MDVLVVYKIDNGLLFDETGDRLSPIHASKAGKRYRYYISSRLKTGRSDHADGWRIPAVEIEAIVLQQIRELLSDKPLLSGWLQEAGLAASTEHGIRKATQASGLLDTTVSRDAREIIRLAIRRIDLASNRIRMGIDRSAVANWLAGTALHPIASDADLHIVGLPLTIRLGGIERRLVIEG